MPRPPAPAAREHPGGEGGPRDWQERASAQRECPQVRRLSLRRRRRLVFISDTPLGKGQSLHIHPYAEVLVLRAGHQAVLVARA